MLAGKELLSAVLLVSAVCRFSLFSSLYLLHLLIWTTLPPLNTAARVRRANSLWYHRIICYSLLFFSGLAILGHIIFQVQAVPNGTEGKYGDNLTPAQQDLFRQLGFTRLDTSWWNIARLIAPDVVIPVVVYVTLRLLRKYEDVDYLFQRESVTFSFIRKIRDNTLVFCVTLIAVGISFQSIPNAIYLFLAFCILVPLVLHLTSQHLYTARKLIVWLSATQLLALHVYQMQFFQRADPDLEIAGMVIYVDTTPGRDPLVLRTVRRDWSEWVYPILLFVAFYFAALSLVVKQRKSRRNHLKFWWDDSPVHSEAAQKPKRPKDKLSHEEMVTMAKNREGYFYKTDEDGRVIISMEEFASDAEDEESEKDPAEGGSPNLKAATDGQVSKFMETTLIVTEPPDDSGISSGAGPGNDDDDIRPATDLDFELYGDRKPVDHLRTPSPGPATSNLSPGGSVRRRKRGLSLSFPSTPMGFLRNPSDLPGDSTTGDEDQNEDEVDELEPQVANVADAMVVESVATIRHVFQPISTSKFMTTVYWGLCHFSCLVTMMVWAFEFPSIFGFILFVWAAVGLVVPRHWFLRSSVVLVVLMALAIVVEYIYSVPDSRFGDKSYPLLDLRPRGSGRTTFSLGLKSLIFLQIAFVCNFRNFIENNTQTLEQIVELKNQRKQLQRHNATKNREISQLPSEETLDLFIFDESLSETTTVMVGRGDDDEEMEMYEKKKKKSWYDKTKSACYWFCKRTGKLLLSFGELVLEFVLRYTYALTLLFIFVAALEEVSVTNAVYMALSVVFWLSRALARKYWLLMVTYAGLVITIEYIWGFRVSSSEEAGRLIGVDENSQSNLWATMKWHATIFALAIIQLYSYRIEAAQKSTAVANDDPDSNEHYSAIGILLEKLVLSLWPILTALGLLLNGILRRPNMLSFGHLLFLYVYLALYFFDLRGLARKMWTIPIVYSGITPLIMYIYQFDDVRDLLLRSFSQESLTDFGLISQNSQSARFRYLFGPVVVFVLCVTQQRLFQGMSDWRVINISYTKLFTADPMETDHATFHSKFLFQHLSTVRRVGILKACALGANTLSVLLIFTSTLHPRGSFFDGITLVLLAMYLTFPPAYFSLLWSGTFLLWLELLSFMKLIYQLQSIDDEREDLPWAGFVKTGSPEKQVKWYIVSIAAILFQRAMYSQALIIWNGRLDSMYLFFVDRHERSSHWSSFKYKINHFIRLYGVEICFAMCVVVSYARLNFYGLVYITILGVYLKISRISLGNVWRVWLIFISLLVAFGYLAAIGVPPSTSLPYSGGSRTTNAILRWFYLPPITNTADDINEIPGTPRSWTDSTAINADFALLFVCSLQMKQFQKVFKKIRREKFLTKLVNMRSLQRGIRGLMGDKHGPFEPNPELPRAQQLWDFLRHHVLVIGVHPKVFEGPIVGFTAPPPTGLAILLAKLFPSFVLLFLLLTAVSRLSVWGFGYMLFAFGYMAAIQKLLSDPDQSKRIAKWTRLLWFNYAVLLITISWTLPAALINWSNQLGALDIVDIFGLRFGFGFRLLPTDTRVDVWELSGLGMDITLFILLQVQFHILGSRESILIGEHHRRSLAEAQERGKGVIAKLVRNSMAILERERGKLNRAKSVLVKLKSRTKTGQLHQIKSLPQWFSQDTLKSEYVDAAESEDEAEHAAAHPTLIPEASKSTHPGSPRRPRRNTTIDLGEPNDLEEEEEDTQEEEKSTMFGTLKNKIVGIINWLATFVLDALTKENNYYRNLYGEPRADSPRSYLVAFFEELFYFFRARTHWLCYFFMILAALIQADLLSIMYPLALFTWGSVARPRPNFYFWWFIITYTEIVIFLKYLFEYGFVSDNSPDDCKDPTQIHGDSTCNTWLRLIGLTSSANARDYVGVLFPQAMVLFSCFIHRQSMKSLGIWRHSDEEHNKVVSIDVDKVIDVNVEHSMVGKHKRSSSGSSSGSGSGSSGSGSSGSGSSYASSGSGSSRSGTESDYTSWSSYSDSYDSEPPANEEVELADGPTDQSTPARRPRRRLRRRATRFDDFEVNTLLAELDDAAADETFYDDNPVVSQKALEEDADDLTLVFSRIYLTIKSVVYGLRHIPNFIQSLSSSRGANFKDYYVFSVTVEFLSFITIVVGYEGFTEEQVGTNVSTTTALSNNEVPLQLLGIMLIQFILIALDRVIYLHRAMRAKVLLHYLSVISIHVTIFYLLPRFTNRPFSENTPIVMLYLFKLLYFFLSAAQIKAGFPTSVLTNVFTTSTSKIYYFSFLVYKAVPFLYELRTLLDWTCTRTTSNFRQWVKLADIQDQLYINGYRRHVEQSSSREYGEKRSFFEKLTTGTGVTVALFFLLWFPLILVALIQGQTVTNVPVSGEFSFTIGTFEPLYLDRTTVGPVSTTLYASLVDRFPFVSNFNREDVRSCQSSEFSSNNWDITDQQRQLLEQALQSNTSAAVTFSWEFNRDPDTVNIDVSSRGSHTKELTPTEQQNLLDLVQSNVFSVEISEMIPAFVGLDATGVTSTFNQQFVSITLDRITFRGEYFSIVQDSATRVNDESMDGPEIITLNDRVLRPSLSFLAGQGIISLYVSVVLVVGRLLRMWMFQMSRNIIYEDMPQVQTLRNVMGAINLAREFKVLDVEEVLVDLVIQLYRSPEALIRWSESYLISPF